MPKPRPTVTTPPSGHPLRILFVCFGNICRSPMAVGIAAAAHARRARAESCGVGAVRGTRATPEAVLAVKTLFGADIAGHSARPIEDVDLGAFDAVIAMDFTVYNRVRSLGVPDEKLFGWEIADPLSLGYRAYKDAARRIAGHIERFLDEHA